MSITSVSSRVEELMLGCYNQRFCGSVPVLNTIEGEVFSRIIGLMISPAAAIDLLLNGATICAPGHVQRVRDAVFPLLFGSLFGLVHPYLGTYAAEPAKKHIAAGILLSGTAHGFNAVISPLTAMEEIASLGSKSYSALSENELGILNKMFTYEREFEKIQSFDFFNLNLTGKIGNQLLSHIEDSNYPKLINEIAKRVALVVYPVLALLDFSVMLLTSTLCFGATIVKVLGGQSSAYLETASSPELLFYNIVKIPLFLIAATFKMMQGLVDPQKAFSLSSDFSQMCTKTLFQSKMNTISKDLQEMRRGERILIPSVTVRSENNEQGLLPSVNSHMRYILVEKIADDQYEAELIERGGQHAKTNLLSHAQMKEVLSDILSLRFKFAANERSNDSGREFTNHQGLIDLGQQTSINNCVITNLFASIQVLRAKEGRNDFDALCLEVKRNAIDRYAHYSNDFYPFGGMAEILEEIERISPQIV